MAISPYWQFPSRYKQGKRLYKDVSEYKKKHKLKTRRKAEQYYFPKRKPSRMEIANLRLYEKKTGKIEK